MARWKKYTIIAGAIATTLGAIISWKALGGPWPATERQLFGFAEKAEIRFAGLEETDQKLKLRILYGELDRWRDKRDEAKQLLEEDPGNAAARELVEDYKRRIEDTDREIKDIREGE